MTLTYYASNNMPKSKVQKRRLADLHDHPRQHEIFGDVTEAELDELARDMQENGLRDPIRITAAGTIITGHQRVRAARRLGWQEIDVIVCANLEEMGPDALVRLLITDNLHRRQLDPLAIGRASLALRKLPRAKQDVENWQPRRDVRDEIGEKLGYSGRTLDRYMRILRTPRAVQDAFSAGRLSLTLAGKVAGLSRAAQSKIAGRISAGESPKGVVTSFIRDSAPSPKEDLTTIYRELISYLSSVTKKLSNRIGEIRDSAAGKPNVAALDAAIAMFGALRMWEKAAQRRSPPKKEILALLGKSDSEI
jgi:ParB/RepB/Spo0J family partition protein